MWDTEADSSKGVTRDNPLASTLSPTARKCGRRREVESFNYPSSITIKIRLARGFLPDGSKASISSKGEAVDVNFRRIFLPSYFIAALARGEGTVQPRNSAAASIIFGGSLSSPGDFSGVRTRPKITSSAEFCPTNSSVRCGLPSSQSGPKIGRDFLTLRAVSLAKAAKRGWRDGGQIVRKKELARQSVARRVEKSRSVCHSTVHTISKRSSSSGRGVNPGTVHHSISAPLKIDGAPQDRQGKPQRFKFLSDIGHRPLRNKVPASGQRTPT
ncbi:hypothetical protein THAOC_28562, partial [Thalassiosira oceanica]